MSEYTTEHGEIIDPDEEMTPYKQACKKLTAFKLRLIETVAADPSLSKAPCLAAIVVYLGFLKVNKETLKPTEVYASNLKLMARGNIRTKVTAGLSRKLLVAEGYLVATGSTTKDGCVKFRVENPHDQKIRMHVREAEEFYGAKDCLRKEIERQKKAAKAQGVIVTDTPENARGDSNYTDRVIVTDTKYHRVDLRGSCSEGRDDSQEGKSGYRDLDDLNPYASFTIPDNDNEAEEILSHVGNVHPYIKTELRRMLMAGELTPALLMSNFGGGDGKSA